jgi:hypothetical protein
MDDLLPAEINDRGGANASLHDSVHGGNFLIWPPLARNTPRLPALTAGTLARQGSPYIRRYSTPVLIGNP